MVDFPIEWVVRGFSELGSRPLFSVVREFAAQSSSID